MEAANHGNDCLDAGNLGCLSIFVDVGGLQESVHFVRNKSFIQDGMHRYVQSVRHVCSHYSGLKFPDKMSRQTLHRPQEN